MYSSETSKHRAFLQRFCIGAGCDIGFGGDPITENAIRIDMPQPYAETGKAGVQLGGDCRNLEWFQSDTLDFVYSSHVLEDFPEESTAPILAEWMRVLKVGGLLVLLLPDQQRYLEHCTRTGQPKNLHHAIDHFSLEYIKSVTTSLENVEFVEGADLPEDYSFYAVFRKNGVKDQRAQEGELRIALNVALEENRRLGSEVLALRQKVDRLRYHPLLGPLLRLRAKLLSLR